MAALAFRRALLIARVVAVHDGHVLLAHHRHGDGRDFWCFPGGHVEEGEGFVEAAVREIEEETGLRVQLLHVVYVQDFLDPPRDDAAEIFFRARVVGGELAPTLEPDLVEVAWVPLTRLGRYRVLPAPLAEAVADGRWEAWRLPVPRPARKLGA